MILLLLILAAMTLVVLAVVVVPLLRPTRAAPERAEFDRAVYRDQLKELERDAARGLIAPGEAAPTRLELERRLLAADSRAPTPPPRGNETFTAAIAVALTLVLAGGGWGLYAAMGSPRLPDLPYADRGPEIQQAAQEAAQLKQIKGMVESLAERLKTQPDDLAGWLRLGRSYAVLGDKDKAVDAYDHAASLKPDDPAILEAEAQVLLQGLQISDPMPAKLIALLHRIDTLAPNNPFTLWYLGLAAAQDHRFDEAKADWQKVLDALPKDSPERGMVSGALEAVKGK